LIHAPILGVARCLHVFEDHFGLSATPTFLSHPRAGDVENVLGRHVLTWVLRTLRPLMVLLAFVGGVGCESPGPEIPDTVRLDSAGVQVILNPSVRGQPVSPSFSLRSRFAIGAAQQDTLRQLFNVGGAALLPGGR